MVRIKNNSSLKPMPLWESMVFFGIPTIALYLTSHYGIAYLMSYTGIHPLLSWFINGGFIFISLFIIAIAAYRFEVNSISFSQFKKRFRLHPLNKEDWYWTIGIFILGSILMGIIFFIEKAMIPNFTATPSFMEMEAVTKNQLWMLLVWLPFFFFNIVGEELLWRGYILPRQGLNHGKFAWLINTLCWTIFHIPFGWKLILTTLPILLLIPFVVQKRRNTWIGIIIHGVINGAAFLSIFIGII